ncbi:cytochrome c oxidase subunit 7A2, mitochondrial-like [Xiphophorus maculatus]|uniref:Cytochrome c oxidase subunit 7A1, mitochondrial n=2 Tax=Xiphophorus TaxID=8082 RepID=A0A3B5Q5M1_XIPMA|nr:cytochrome c oxidase subunit 7A2, mitochondrial-like [Xiphophorus maculatus]XP_027901170.1 cytochrome c oxidase subunit 7A2, mitochondrial-like [Xiphophorus couchianus]
MNRLLNVPVAAVRAFSSSSRNLKNKVPEAQKLFQEDNGLPVHIKGGTSDVLLYRATMLLTAAGTCYSLYWLLVASMPNKKE